MLGKVKIAQVLARAGLPWAAFWLRLAGIYWNISLPVFKTQ